jgi:hypothetical protein
LFPPDRQKDFIYRLGNLALLEPAINRDARNALFDQKQGLFAKSAYAGARDLASGPSEWTPAVLTVRQERMAQRAAHIWRADFA